MQDDWKANVKAIVSLVLACLSVVCCCAWYISLILAVAAIVFGILGYRDENPNQKDAAIAGIIVGASERSTMPKRAPSRFAVLFLQVMSL